jgi:TldD protein
MCRQQSKPYGYLVKTLAGPANPLLLYRVSTNDGHEELVRGGVFKELDTRALRNSLIAIGNDPEVSNNVAGVPYSVISPSLLFDELEVKRTEAGKEKLPEYAPPSLGSQKVSSLTTEKK